MLERRPDEFGLVLDQNGYVKVKELLKAIHEEEGWKYVRRSQLDEIAITISDPAFEFCDNLVRARHRQHLPKHTLALDLPKLMYTCIRQKAYPYAAAEGLSPSGYRQVILSSDRKLAQRMGKRIDRAPILLTVNVQQSRAKDVIFYQAGEALYLADFIPSECFTGPPLPKEKSAITKTAVPDNTAQPKPAGSFFVNMDERGRPVKSADRKRDSAKSSGKKMKKIKRKRERPPWRK
jgi:putative RNA 2'-phosphotransferase